MDPWLQNLSCELKLYLVMPKSLTFTTLFSFTRQFLAAWSSKHNLKDIKTRSCSTAVCVWDTHQVSVDETVGLQVLHPLADVLTHGQKPRLLQSPAPLTQEVQQAAVLQELGHDLQGPLLQTHAVQLNQLRMTQPPAETEKQLKHSRELNHFSFKAKATEREQKLKGIKQEVRVQIS